jgi:hypothetical protein
MSTIVLVLLLISFVLLLLAAGGVAHARIQLQPLGLAFAVLALLFVRGFPP